MPVEYLTPGVYVEEVESGLKPISGVGTNTTGFIGQVGDAVLMPVQPGKFVMEPDPKDATKQRKKMSPVTEPDPDNPGKTRAATEPDPDNPGRRRTKTEPDPDAPGQRRPITAPEPLLYQLAPVGEPRLVTSWEQFKMNFGDFQDANIHLAHAVYGFFNNGGGRAWISRVKLGDRADGYRRALERFEAIDEIALLVIPGASPEIQDMMLTHCENQYLQDRFAILDGQPVPDLTKDAIQGGLRDSSYGAIYYPWIQVYDPVSDSKMYVPPSGHIAGVYARVDDTRGVHKAPANEVIRGALGVGVVKPDAPKILSKADQAGLNPRDINVIRKFDGNMTIWGAHTLIGEEDSEWRYINVRRLFLFLRKSIDHGTQWVVFEPNDSMLWGKITRDVSDFLRRVWRSGALFGTTEAQAFFVKCDESNNPREVRDAGQVIIDIGVAPVKPAEFVIFRISQWAGPTA